MCHDCQDPRHLSVLYQMVDDYIPNMTLHLPPFRPLWSLTWLRFVFGFVLAKDNFIATLTKHYGEIFPTYPNVPRPEMSVGWELTCRPQSEGLEKRRCYQKWVIKNTTSVGLFGGEALKLDDSSTVAWWNHVDCLHISWISICIYRSYTINHMMYSILHRLVCQYFWRSRLDEKNIQTWEAFHS